ncbi:hypothetical protein BC835DRAFT_1422968 [Cytidiella melzeri]|nr:hypothetical protein BC835DRAFT_1422968 [Cytidiella melzeri]
MTVRGRPSDAASTPTPPLSSSRSITSPFRHYDSSERPAYCKIGKQPVLTPLVSLPQVKAHLSLLRAIKDLRRTVEEGTDERFPEYVKMLQPAQRWIWMVGLAIERCTETPLSISSPPSSLGRIIRFMKWIKTVQPTQLSAWLEDQLPPLDVLMVWHTYMLNPQWYAEDCDRLKILRGLKSVNDYLLQSLVAVEDIGAYEPSDDHRQSWRDAYGTSWDPLNAAGDGTLEHHDVVCPKCLIPQSVSNVDDQGHGYLQNAFMSECTECSGLITKERLAVHKLVQDLVRDHTADEDVHEYGLGVYLPGTLRTHTEAADVIGASNVKKRVRNTEACSRSLAAVAMYQPKSTEATASVWERSLVLELESSMGEVRRQVRQAFPSSKGEKIVNRIFSAYTDDRPFSVDLVGAILRQGTFIDKMHEVGWTTQDRFSNEEDVIILAHAIGRYHAFLDLLSTSPTSLFVPTLDIDLVWHTHQLMGHVYAEDCLKYVGRYIDHDDKVEESHLANSFDQTCMIQRQFGVPFTHCGCPTPVPDTGFKRLRTVVSSLNMTRSASVPILNLIPPDHPDALSATHASEHNAFLFATNSRGFGSQERLARQERIKQWQEYEERTAKRREVAFPVRRGDSDHDPAFLAAPPFWAFAGAPLGVCTAASYTGRVSI